MIGGRTEMLVLCGICGGKKRSMRQSVQYEKEISQNTYQGIELTAELFKEVAIKFLSTTLGVIQHSLDLFQGLVSFLQNEGTTRIKSAKRKHGEKPQHPAHTRMVFLLNLPKGIFSGS
jgi:hypothetical protein